MASATRRWARPRRERLSDSVRVCGTERVDEGESIGPRAQDQGRGFGHVQHIDQRLLILVGDGGQQAELEVSTDDRRQREDLECVVAQGGDASPDDLAHARGESDLGHRNHDRPVAVHRFGQRTGLDQVAQHLADEEGISRGLVSQGLCEDPSLLAEVVARDQCQQFGELRAGDAGEREALDAWLAPKSGDEIKKCVRCRDVGIPVRAQNQQPAVDVRGDVPKEQEGGRIGPVEVIEHEDHGDLPGHRCQRRRYPREPQVAFGLGFRCRWPGGVVRLR